MQGWRVGREKDGFGRVVILRRAVVVVALIEYVPGWYSMDLGEVVQM